MSETNKKIKKKADDLRVVIMNDATFEEKFAWSFAQNNLWIWGGLGVLVVFILFFLLIAFTPIKRLMPGYASIENNVYVIKMKTYVDDLEKQINLQEKYNNTLRKLLVGQGDSLLLSEEYQQQFEEKDSGNDNISEEIYSLEKNIPGGLNRKKSKIASYYYIPPLNGKVLHAIDFKKGHYGVDIAGAKNSAIKATMEGIVVLSDYTTETGYTIAIQHPNDMLSVYKHNSRLLKDIGNFVANGEAIAIIGNTGTLTDGPHLHFELWYKSTPLNPIDYVLFE